LYTLRGGKVNLVEIDVPASAREPMPRISELDLPEDAVLVCIFRGDDTVIARGPIRLKPRDQVIALTTPELEDELRASVLQGRR
ncbi:MAG: TrkA C-terminal domain-containing protein, partial [Egibacteraceae bacterium]